MKDYRVKKKSVKAKDNESLWWALIEHLQSEIQFKEDADREMMASLTAGQRALLALDTFNRGVSCDGIDGFFSNSMGILSKEVLEGYELIGARGHAARVRAVYALFPGGEPPRDRPAREKALARIPAAKKRKLFESFDSDFMSFALSQDDVYELVGKYVAEHPADFYKD